MKVERNKHGEVVVRGTWSGTNHLELPHCDCCGQTQWFYLSNLPREWRLRDVEITAKLVTKRTPL